MSGQIFELIPKVMKDIGAVAKSSKNEAQKYMFRGIDAFYQAAHPALIAHGVFCAPEVVERTEYRFDKINDYGKTTTWIHVTLKVVHRFYAPDGSSIEVTTVGEGLDNSDKASNKSMSAAMKYALIELFCVPTEDIEDSDKTSPEAGGVRPPVPAKPVVLTPKPPVKVPDDAKLEPPMEEAVEESLYIDSKQRSYLARRFRESVRPEKQPQAEEARHAALGAMALSGLFKSKFVDAAGNPTSEFILKQEYSQVGAALVKAAKSL